MPQEPPNNSNNSEHFKDDLFYYNDEAFRANMVTFNLPGFHKDKQLIIFRANREYFLQLAQNNLTIPR